MCKRLPQLLFKFLLLLIGHLLRPHAAAAAALVRGRLGHGRGATQSGEVSSVGHVVPEAVKCGRACTLRVLRAAPPAKAVSAAALELVAALSLVQPGGTAGTCPTLCRGRLKERHPVQAHKKARKE